MRLARNFPAQCCGVLSVLLIGSLVTQTMVNIMKGIIDLENGGN